MVRSWHNFKTMYSLVRLAVNNLPCVSYSRAVLYKKLNLFSVISFAFHSVLICIVFIQRRLCVLKFQN